ncbi:MULTISPECIES: hypothetical protein [Devosia]|uniref:hypothetical protein n=1 Tax=Devosia TaxID=46913 RepID=UPI000CE98E03|nr:MULTISPECIES: hypothetical protein [Devosia]AVF03904.1 hypothetical protein C4375_09315 [Devosia sp. I507]
MADGRDITLTIHGLVEFNDEVDGEVFAEKFSAFMRGLAASDIAANGERRHQFIIGDLRKNTATAQIVERKNKVAAITHSGASYFEQAIDEIRRDSQPARLLPLKVVESVVTLNRGVGRSFQFGEIKVEGDNVIRLDPYLAAQAEKVLADIKKLEGKPAYFAGMALGSFDGTLRAVDFQQAQKTGVVRLSAGDLPLTCDISRVPLEEIAAALEKRAVFYGTARYDGKSGLPRLLEVRRIEVVPKGEGLVRWQAAFEAPPGDDEDWEAQ